MTNEQMIGLRKSMQRFGYLTPVVIDINTNKIADGEHRALIYKELGIEEIPAIRMPLETDADRRQLRQVMNKLHGIHDKTKDANELVALFESQKLDELSEMLARNRPAHRRRTQANSTRHAARRHLAAWRPS
jgi:ParB-like chromosome segregation protein Spo0J